MQQGTVKNWIADRGFGFIEPERGGADVFVHVSALDGRSELTSGTRVEFDEELDRRGKTKAVNVRVLASQVRAR
jgi:CspA family cold shock protein